LSGGRYWHEEHMTPAETTMTFYGTSIGKKTVMAVTGIILFGFVVGHLLGNLQVFAGPARLNAYAELLHRSPALLWMVRVALLATVLLHMVTGLLLKLQSWRSRGRRYACFTPLESTVSSRWMLWTGLAMAAFVVYHLLHLTLGVVVPGFRAEDVYGNVVAGFSRWSVAVSYFVAMVLLGLHLFHGLYSMFQSVGLSEPRSERRRRAFASAFTIALVAGNVLMPAAVLVGWIR
jgi:succinate dehydrogenase / fumarate reductase cytochrome b subunit